MTREEVASRNKDALLKDFQDRVDVMMPSSCPVCGSDFLMPGQEPSTSGR
jgi:hypothetical protein